MGRSKNSDGIGDEFTASKKRGKKKTVSKDKRIVNKRNTHKKNANKNITLRRKRGTVYVGLGLHKNTIQMAAVDQKGTLLCNYKFQHTREDVDSEVSKMPKNAKYVIESSSVWNDTFHFMRDELGLDVILSNPYTTKLIAESKKKTDKVDAAILADMLGGGYIAECHVAGSKTTKERDLVRYRHMMVEIRTRMKNSIHGILLQNSMKPTGVPFTHRWVAQLRQMQDYRTDGYLAIIESLDNVIMRSNIRIRDAVNDNPDAMLLKSIPGVGDYTALIIASAIDGIERFHSSEKLSAYAGIVPSVRSSADIAHHGRITRRGSNILRWILVECVHSHVRFAPSSDVSMFYYRIRKKRGGGKAAVAAASKMLHVMWWRLKEKRGFVKNYS